MYVDLTICLKNDPAMTPTQTCVKKKYGWSNFYHSNLKFQTANAWKVEIRINNIF